MEITYLKTFKEKSFGLIGKKSPYPIFFKTRFGIHTFGLNFPIDIAILDNKGNIVKIKENLPPNSLFFWNPKYYFVLELPPGTIKKNNLRISSKISLKSVLSQTTS